MLLKDIFLVMSQVKPDFLLLIRKIIEKISTYKIVKNNFIKTMHGELEFIFGTGSGYVLAELVKRRHSNRFSFSKIVLSSLVMALRILLINVNLIPAIASIVQNLQTTCNAIIFVILLAIIIITATSRKC